MITFDDGWKDQYVYAAPILEKYGFNAVFFIYPKMIGNGGAFMTRDQVVDLDKRGFDIQSHTWGHVSLVHKAETSFRGFERWTRPQFTQTADWTEKYIGKKPIALAYPYGYYDLDIIGILQGNDVKLAFTVDEGVSDARAWDRLALKRFTITRGGSLTQFANRITGTPFPARDIQPPPGSRLKSRSATITADISELPRDVSGISFAGSSLGETTIIKKDGKRYAVARLKNGKPGFHYITLRGAGADGKKYLSSWSMVLGN
jgi:peptidoglycan/xylan/chitin deacetylase (PgdA/CDA1 family)